jgi:hypothetical protein
MISILNNSAHFLLSEWIWSITWGIYMLPFSTLILFVLLRWVERIHAVRALLVTLAAHICAWVCLTGFVVGILIFTFQIEYVPDDTIYHEELCSLLYTSLYLGLIYTLLESLFFFIIRKKVDINIFRVIALIIMSNCLAALCVYVLLSKI